MSCWPLRNLDAAELETLAKTRTNVATVVVEFEACSGIAEIAGCSIKEFQFRLGRRSCLQTTVSTCLRDAEHGIVTKVLARSGCDSSEAGSAPCHIAALERWVWKADWIFGSASSRRSGS